MHILITGSPDGGFTHTGPFDSSEDAITWAERNIGREWPWWATELEPTNDIEPDEMADAVIDVESVPAVVLVRAVDEDDRDDDGRPLWWSNEGGWSELGNAVVFTEDEAEQLPLPLGGQWIRFIAEES